MRRTLIAASLLTVFLAAVLAPIAIAHEGSETDPREKEERREARDDRKDEKRELKEDRKAEKRELKEERKAEKRELKEERKEAREERKEAKKAGRFVKANFSLDLSGTMLGRDNATYTFDLVAQGQGMERVKAGKANDSVRYQARVLAHLVIRDSNGTVVEESDLRVRLMARGSGDDIRWMLGSFGEKDAPRLLLKGDAAMVEPGQFELDGEGRAGFRLDDRPVPVKVTASGTFTRELPPATSTA